MSDNDQKEFYRNTFKEVLSEEMYFLKTVLNADEAAKYLSISKSKLYKHTSKNNITFHRPEGGHIYFRRVDLDAWMLRNKTLSNDDISREAARSTRNR